MSYNLQSWNKLISESLCPEELEQLRGEEFMNEILERTMEQNEQVKYRIIEDLLERTKIKDKRQYIKVTQVMLVHFLDKLYSYGQQKSVNLCYCWWQTKHTSIHETGFLKTQIHPHLFHKISHLVHPIHLF